MKISEMTFAQASETMLRIAAPISNICDDEELTEILKGFVGQRGRSNLQMYGRTIPRLLTYCLDNHKIDTYEIIEALLGIPKAKIDTAKFTDIVNGLRESYDEVLAGFFTRSGAAKKSEGTK